jgi:hypothetical protein
MELPRNCTDEQIDIYHKNVELYNKAIKNRNRYSVIVSMCCDLGFQYAFVIQRFINV